MKVADLNNINEIDSSIQTLLSELTSLYSEREKLFRGTRQTTTKKRQRRTKLSDIDFNAFDLNLPD